MSLVQFLAHLRDLNIQVWVENDTLRYQAPQGVMTAELLAGLKERRTEIINFIKQVNSFSHIEPVAAQAYYPLSPAQQRMYVMNQVDKKSTAYNIVNVLKITGGLDQKRLARVFGELIHRHESLRTSFEIVNGEPVQKIHPTVDFEPVYLEHEGPDTSINDILAGFIRPYDLSQAPLFRLMVVKLTGPEGGVSFFILIDMHHIISDGVSGAILINDFNALYGGQTLPELRIQYKDYAVWYRRLLTGPAIEPRKKYWLEEFQNEIPVLNLPTDFPRPTAFTFQGKYVYRQISRELTGELYGMARENRVTLYTVLLAAYYLLLSKYTGQNDIVIGTPTAGRQHEDLRNVIGMFVNTLALRNYPLPEKNFTGFLKEVGAKIVKAFDHQDYPFEQLVEELHIQRDAGRNPIFDTMLVLQNIEINDLQGEGLRSSRFRPDRGLILFDIRLDATETENGIELEIHYCDSLFRRDSMERFGGHYANILAAVAQNPRLLLGEIQMLSGEEKRQILDDFNNTNADYPKGKTLHGLIEEQVRKTPDSTAVIYTVAGPEGWEDRTLTYRELDEKANRLAHYLQVEGEVKPDSLAGILMERSGDLMVALLGILKAGGAYVPIDPKYPEERIKTIINDAGLRVIISSKKHLKTLNRLQWECPSFTTYICLDSEDVHFEEETEKNELMDEKLWDYVGSNARDEIAGGGWVSSYTGEDFSREEMEEYSENILAKLGPYLHPKARVLEIGCASGLTMFKIAPRAGFYFATDISPKIIENNQTKVTELGFTNIRLAALPAHEIDRIDDGGFDIVILNSVIHCFHGHNYLRKVIKKAIELMKPQGILFAGDLLDQGRKDDFIQSLVHFKENHQGLGYRTKTDFSAELFVSREFFEDLQADLGTIQGIDFSNKIHTIPNELTRFRYDAVIRIDKGLKVNPRVGGKHKYQHDLTELNKYAGLPAPPTSGPRNLAYVIYTSGSTGKPKGAMIEHCAVINRLHWMQKKYPIGPGDVILQKTPYTFDVSVWELFWWAIAGAKCCFLIPEGEKDPETILEAILKNGITTMHFVPSMLNAFLEYLENGAGLDRLQSLRRVFASGEALGSKQANRFNRLLTQKYKVKLHNLYGPTEATVDVSYFDCPPGENLEIVPIGRPIDNIALLILNNQQQLQPIGVPGELYISGAGVGRGYLNRPELTVEKFVSNPFEEFRVDDQNRNQVENSGLAGCAMTGAVTPNSQLFYKTGDLARWLPDGNIEYLGRLDHQIKIRGFRIELGEIETQLLRNHAIREAVVTAEDDNDGNKYLCAYLTGNEDLTLQQLRSYLLNQLPEYMVPARFVLLPKMPVSPNGKIDRKALAAHQEALDTGIDFEAPGTEIEKKMADLWQEILGRNNIGINDNFFELGGHSLKATTMVSRVHRELNVEVPLKEVFNQPTIKALAQYIARKDKNLFSGIPPVKESEYYPLSSAQKRLLVLHRLESESVTYNMPGVMLLEGRLDRARFHRAVDQLIERHESLRTSIEFIDGEPVQKIRPMESIRDAFRIEYWDIDGLVNDGLGNGRDRSVHDRSGSREGSIPEIIKEFIRPFDLSQAPLLRVGLVRLAQDLHVFLCDMSHIISDGVSMDILIKEFSALYEGKEISGLRIQYKDFAAWQNQLFESEQFKKQEAYWLNAFRDQLPVLNLPYDYPRPAVFRFEGNTLSFAADRELTARLREVSSVTGGTLFMTLLGAYNIFLSKYSGQEDIIIGSPIAGRPHSDLQNIIGVFVNTLALRNYPQGDKTIAEFLREVKERTLTAYENQDYPFEELVEKLQIRRDLSRNPIFDTMFSLQNQYTPILELGGLKISTYEFENTVSKFDLTLTAVEAGGKILFNFEYCASLFRRETIQRMAKHYLNALGEVTANLSKKIRDVEILTTAEKRWLLYEFNDTGASYPKAKTLHEMFEDRAAQNPERIAVLFAGQRLTYRELNQSANQLGRILIEKGVRSKDHVALITERGLAMIFGMFAILKCGATYVPIDPEYPDSRKEYIIRNSKVSAVLVDQEYDVLHENTLMIEPARFGSYPAGNLDLKKDSRDLAYVIYTSGSTGTPKGVMIEHHAAVNLIAWVNKEFQVDENDKLLFITSMCFDLSVYDIFGILAAGGQVVIAKKEQVQDPGELKALLTRNRITFWDSVPSTMNFLVNSMAETDPGYTQDYLRLVFLSGDWIPVSLPRRLEKFFPNARVISLGGATEGTVWSIYYPVERGAEYQTSIPYGRPIDNNYFYILDRNLKPVPMGVAGELYIGGVGVARGYMNDEQKTKTAFLRNPFLDPPMGGGAEMMYKTGDLGRMLPDGNIEFLGRCDHQVKIRGYRVELGEIESKLSKHPAVKEVVAVDKTGADGHKFLCAYIVWNQELTIAGIREYLSQELPDYMIPAYFISVDHIPLTSNGKIDRNALPKPGVSMNTGVEYIAPRNGIEAKLAMIWQEVLGIEKIGIDDDFFELGGHSLKATLVAGNIHKQFNVELPLKEIFQNPTVKGLAAYIQNAKSRVYAGIEPVAKQEYYLLSSAQKRLYVLNLLEGPGTGYNMPSILRIEGKLDRKRFEETLKSLTERHETLRTSFEFADGQPVQRVHQSVELQVNYLQANDSQVDDFKTTAGGLGTLFKEFVRPFDLSVAPLLRVALVQQTEDRYVMMLDMHHIISDGISVALFAREFMDLYHGRTLPNLTIQYRDFAVWENKWLESSEFKKQRNYWLEKFSGKIPALNMPLDFPRPSTRSIEGDRVEFETGAELAARLRETARKNNLTLYMILLAAYTILLAKYTGQEDIVIGSGTAGRLHPDLENVMGIFVNTLMMRNRPRGNKTLGEFFSEVRENTLMAYENQSYPFDKLVEELGIERDPARMPLHDTVFMLQNMDIPEIEVEGLKVTAMAPDFTIAENDLALFATEKNERILFSFIYCSKLFTKETITKLSGYYLKVAELITGGEELRIQDIRILDDDEQKQALAGVHQSQKEFTFEFDV